eukprot:scaffold746_cov112-Isochrysis_galbana.AAC.2
MFSSFPLQCHCFLSALGFGHFRAHALCLLRCLGLVGARVFALRPSCSELGGGKGALRAQPSGVYLLSLARSATAPVVCRSQSTYKSIVLLGLRRGWGIVHRAIAAFAVFRVVIVIVIVY